MSIVLVFLNIILIFLIVFPLALRKFNGRKSLSEFNTIGEIEPSLVQASLKMVASRKVFMPFVEHDDLYTLLSRLKNKLFNDKRHFNYGYFNFPRAYLLVGCYRYGVSQNRADIVNEVVHSIDILLDKFGNLKFVVDKLDHSVFGLLFGELYLVTKEQRYLSAMDAIYAQLQEFKTQEGVYLYRQSVNVLFIDTLGMIVPFLVTYAKIKQESNLMEEAAAQIDYFLSKTVSGLSEFPCHAYDLDSQIRLGSNNWSRGMGWFMMGLAFVSGNDKKYMQLFDMYDRRLTEVMNDGCWPQFFGHTHDRTIDSSATLMFIFSKLIAGLNVNSSMLSSALNKAIDRNGFVIENTGDTIYINVYSRVKGRSELSQGLLMWILSKELK